MKLSKNEFSLLLKNMLEQYNMFVSAESLANKTNAFFEKLQWQENDVVKKVMVEWDGSKMPTAPELLKKCKELSAKKSVSNILAPHEQICRYMDYGDVDECEISRYMCANQSENFPITADWVSFCLNSRPDKKTICYWHCCVITDRIKIREEMIKYGSIKDYDIYFTKRTIKDMASLARYNSPVVPNSPDHSIDDERQGSNLDVSKMYREVPKIDNELSHLLI